MSQDFPCLPVHPAGEQPPGEQDCALAAATLDTWAGPIRVEWDPTAPLTPYGQLPFFIEYLKVAGLSGALVADCPLAYTSPNAPDKRDVLGTTMLSILAGRKRYAHIATLRNDGVLPELLGMKRTSARTRCGALSRPSERTRAGNGCNAISIAPRRRFWPSRGFPTRIPPSSRSTAIRKGLYLVGYNPKKPGRPSHVCHTYTMAGLRLVLDVEVAPGNEHAHAAPGLWALLDRIPRDCRPAFLRGDSGFGTEAAMREAERRGLPYLFKLRLTARFLHELNAEQLTTDRRWRRILSRAVQSWLCGRMLRAPPRLMATA